jgi:hypothetical protein
LLKLKGRRISGLRSLLDQATLVGSQSNRVWRFPLLKLRMFGGR